MWPFKKKGEETLDLTLLHKRGLLKVPEEKPDLDLTQQQSISQPIPTDSSALSFLGDMASAESESGSVSNSPTNSFSRISSNKIDDMEYKLDSFSKRLDTVLDRLDLAEKKIDRLERKKE